MQKQVQGPDTDYVVDTNRSLPVVLHDGSGWYVYGLDLIARITTGGPAADRQRYYHHDGLGTTRAVTDANGNTDATYNYDVFGAIRSQTGSITNDFQYTGEQRDDESSYYFLRARYYDPVVGRFVSRDPFGGFATAPPSLNRYCYVRNNPANLADPSGLSPRRSQVGNCPAAVAAGLLGIVPLAEYEIILAIATVVVAPIPIAELALLPAHAATLYAGLQLLDLAIQGTQLPCDAIQLGAIPFQ